MATTKDIRPSTAIHGLRRVRPHAAARRARGGLHRRRRAPRRCASCASRARCTRAGSARAPSRPTTTASRAPARRRSLLSRLRAPARARRRAARRRRDRRRARAGDPSRRAPAPDAALRHRAGAPARAAREPRHVRAVPTGAEQKIASAVELFNGSEHRRTVAGVARSLGAPGRLGAPVEAASEPRQHRRLLGAVLVPLRGRPLRRGPVRPGRGARATSSTSSRPQERESNAVVRRARRPRPADSGLRRQRAAERLRTQTLRTWHGRRPLDTGSM